MNEKRRHDKQPESDKRAFEEQLSGWPVRSARQRNRRCPERKQPKLQTLPLKGRQGRPRRGGKQIGPYRIHCPQQAEKQKAADDSNEASAKSALRLIEQLIAEGKNDTAKFRLEKFLEKYPGTRAAAKAKELLDSLP